jgi:hypothetical protein
MSDLDDLLRLQSGVIARRQAEGLGLAPHDLERLLRRRQWVRLLPGVFVDHTGVPSWEQRAWAGVLHYWPAALAHDSALRAHRILQGDVHPIQIAVDRHRHLTPVTGYRVRRITYFHARSRWNLSPPRLTVEDAALDVASDAPTDFAAFEVLAAVCRSRHSTPRRLAMAANDRGRLRRRSWLLAVLDDLAAGACSVLERGYLRQVERGHGLPPRTGIVRSPRARARATATSTTRRTGWSSSSTAGCSTTHRPPETVISTGTWRRPS